MGIEFIKLLCVCCSFSVRNKKEHCVPSAIFCLVIGDKSQIRRCAIPRFNFGWQLPCQFQLFPECHSQRQRENRFPLIFQAVIVISLKPLNHFLCHIIVKASVSFKTKCRTASETSLLSMRPTILSFSEKQAIRQPLQSLLVQVWRGVRVKKHLKSPLSTPSFIIHVTTSVFFFFFLSECVQWRTPPGFAPSSFVQFIVSRPQRHANDTEVWGNWARRRWDAARRRLLRRCFCSAIHNTFAFRHGQTTPVCFSSILNPLSLYK